MGPPASSSPRRPPRPSSTAASRRSSPRPTPRRTPRSLSWAPTPTSTTEARTLSRARPAPPTASGACGSAATTIIQTSKLSAWLLCILLLIRSNRRRRTILLLRSAWSRRRTLRRPTPRQRRSARRKAKKEKRILLPAPEAWHRSDRTTLKFKFDGSALTKGETDRQLEFAPECGISTVQIDQNLIVMQVIEEVVAKHGLAALLQETPFADINGSGNVQQLVPLHRLRRPPHPPRAPHQGHGQHVPRRHGRRGCHT